MKNKKKYLLVVLGIVLVSLGIYLLTALTNSQEFMLAIPYICIGIGCGVFGHGIGNIIAVNQLKKHPEIEKQTNIEKSDERNIVISYRAKSKAYDFMIYLFASLLIVFPLIGVEMIPMLILVFAYLLVQGYAIYYRIKYDKEM